MAEGAVAAALGGTASVLFVAPHVPQVLRLVRGPAEGASVGMFTVQLVSGALWVAYGTPAARHLHPGLWRALDGHAAADLALLAARRGGAAAAAQG